MSSIERVSLRRLPAAERDEVESLPRAKNDPRFLSDLADAAAWWILVLVTATAGAVALVLELAQGGLEELRLFPGALAAGELWSAVLSLKLALGLAAVLGIMAWVAVTWIRNHGRRGYLATSFATVRIKGDRLTLMRHARVADVKTESLGRPGKRFTVLKLTGDDGRTLSLYVTGAWTETALARIRDARA
jgi:hypothetical protein